MKIIRVHALDGLVGFGMEMTKKRGILRENKDDIEKLRCDWTVA